jgi:hypothetical protein
VKKPATFVDFSPNGEKTIAAAVVKKTGEEVVANAVVEEVDKATAN